KIESTLPVPSQESEGGGPGGRGAAGFGGWIHGRSRARARGGRATAGSHREWRGGERGGWEWGGCTGGRGHGAGGRQGGRAGGGVGGCTGGQGA
ncbi:hypothetical protein THAOC_32797, partial [Thalassiosira oceanica]